jgi:hypothetical protein
MHKALALLGALMLSGCGYMLTYDDAFPHQHLMFPSWDPPDSIAFVMPEPPRVETVVLDARLYQLLNPPKRRIILAPTIDPPKRRVVLDIDTQALADSLAFADSVAVADSLAFAVAESVAAHKELPSIRVDLSNRLEQAYISRTDRDLAAARRFLSLLGRLKLTPEEQSQVQAVEGFVIRADRALLDRDFEGASNLAFKARTLAESIVESQP